MVMIIIRLPGVHSAHARLPGQVEAAVTDLLITHNSGTWGINIMCQLIGNMFSRYSKGGITL